MFGIVLREKRSLITAANLSIYDTGMFVGILAQSTSDMALMLFPVSKLDEINFNGRVEDQQYIR